MTIGSIIQVFLIVIKICSLSVDENTCALFQYFHDVSWWVIFIPMWVTILIYVPIFWIYFKFLKKGDLSFRKAEKILNDFDRNLRDKK